MDFLYASAQKGQEILVKASPRHQGTPSEESGVLSEELDSEHLEKQSGKHLKHRGNLLCYFTRV